MPRITLPDGSVREFPQPVTARQVAEAIGPRLAQAALGCKVDGELRDLSTLIDRDVNLAIVTPQTRDKQADPDALMLIRHSAAHVMAEAIQRIVPEAQLVYARAGHWLLLRHQFPTTGRSKRATSRRLKPR